MNYADAYSSDRSIKGKVRRRAVRLLHRRPLTTAPTRPMLSFTFDDAPITAVHGGAQVLEARGVRGTYYVSAGLAGQEAPMGVCGGADDYRKLAEAGHEIACHTYSHLDCGQAAGDEVAADVNANAEAFRAWGVPEAQTFAYPYGDVSPATKPALASRFRLLRALHKGVIVKGSDLNQTPGVGVEGPDGEAVARRWIKVAKRRNAWLILYTHDVRDQPSPWGCTPEAWGRLVDDGLKAGFDVVTVAEGARRLGL